MSEVNWDNAPAWATVAMLSQGGTLHYAEHFGGGESRAVTAYDHDHIFGAVFGKESGWRLLERRPQAGREKCDCGDCAKKCSTENVSADVNYATLTAAPVDANCKIVSKEWNGEGDPAVGSLAEDHSIAGAPVYMVEVVATEGGLVSIKRPGLLKVVDLSCLRPVRTAERVEENKRRATISSMENLWREGGFEAIYNAGYRKP